MAVTVEERFRRMQATRMPANTSSYPAAWSVTTAAKRRAASSATITTLAKRRKDSTPPPKSRSTSTPSTRSRQASTPSDVATLALPVERTPGVPYAGVRTLPRTYLNFSHFFRTIGFEIRDKSLKAIENAGVNGEERWRAQHYDPQYATESCKLAFLIQVEIQCGREESEGQQHACYRCYTLKPKGAFEDKPHHIIVSPHGGLSMYAYTTQDLPVIRQGESILRRFCIECGVRDGLYPSTELVHSMTGDRWWVCECRHLHWISPPESYVRCRRCLAKSGFRSLVLEDGTSVSSGGFSP
ncbi:uncharacterized protein LY79DRAFT_274982 [Colletotrichum navitas]|uniref:Uncharacterized protein n=1 Tax=Colletotrichum navitas TaxID=681940 RepID=A0AAD8PV83_9PEZI|nr:uncharacterized protein LY79DRAFT_274982 [Colletotrichum navitas]KAK1585266.1 hypothetical protein LY79DRAFT_274982 [Colletotrichum navitas]